jgi:hypothetical protein
MERLKPDRGRRRLVARSLAGGLLGAALAVVGFIGTAGADLPSDPRAEFVDGANATTCADVGDSSPNILFTNGNADNSNADVSGTVTGGDTLNVTVLNPNVQVNAVVVKGGNGYNVYRGNFPDMIAPLNNGGQLPSISHWFVCYGPAETPPPPPGDGGGAGGAVPEAGAAVAVTAQARFTG